MANGQMNALHKAQTSPLMCLSLRFKREGGGEEISTDILLSNSAAPASKCYYDIVGERRFYNKILVTSLEQLP